MWYNSWLTDAIDAMLSESKKDKIYALGQKYSILYVVTKSENVVTCYEEIDDKAKVIHTTSSLGII